MDEDCISYSKYDRICESKNIPEEHNQEQLIDLLHRLGLVLSFRKHPLLQNTNVLNPNWVTRGIYTLLSDDRLKASQGILTPVDLSRILPAKRYPTNRHPYLTELMKEFQLCFEIDCSSTHSPTLILPGLLPKDEPNDTALEGDTLEFQYHYRVLPESILSRFIVLAHDKIHKQIYWRSGVMLAYTEGRETCNIARIKADPEDKKIFISINGRESTRRTFLGIIRDVFNRIHSTFKSEITEWVPVPNHPDHPPLDYQELLGLEAMGEREYPIGKLRIKVNLRQLLDGYEAIESRQRWRNKFEIDGDYEEDSPYNISVNVHDRRSKTIHQKESTIMSNIHQYGSGDNIAGDKVAGDKINTQINNSQNLAQAAQDIKALLTQLDQDYDRTTPTGQAMISAQAIATIEKNPTLKARIINALKEGGTTALEEAIDHPAVKPVVALLKGFMDAK
ncbi:MAG: GTP-binding protein, partial [Cyanobacteria bacterium CAN_BIN43]|nr:GTP-binding protein [Cyanobacteria bacterium CAN_BIN43]